MKEFVLIVIVIVTAFALALWGESYDNRQRQSLAHQIATDLGAAKIVSSMRQKEDLSFEPVLDVEQVERIVLRDMERAKR